jgi:plastocyanin
MKRIPIVFVVLGVSIAAMFVIGGRNDNDNDPIVVMRDDCDPDDPAWNPTGGCARQRGDVTFAEFNAELFTALSIPPPEPVGHQAWHNDPPYLELISGDSVRVRNRGGRVHTFTKVQNFGGGNVPPLNGGLAPAPECASAENVPPGESTTVEGLTPGNHRYQCCIHPWMRALVKVKD